MKTYEIETTISINDVEFDCLLSFEYEVGEKSHFNEIFGSAQPESGDKATITSAVIQSPHGKTYDIASGQYDFLMDAGMRMELENEAIEYAKNEQRESILDSQISMLEDAA